VNLDQEIDADAPPAARRGALVADILLRFVGAPVDVC